MHFVTLTRQSVDANKVIKERWFNRNNGHQVTSFWKWTWLSLFI